MERKYEAIIFDLDDTLSDDTENRKYSFTKVAEAKSETYIEEEFLRFLAIDFAYWAASTNRFEEAPEEYITVEEKIKWIRAQRFLIYFNEKISLQEAMKLNEIYMEALKEVVVPIKGAKELLIELKEKGYFLGIATNGPTEALTAKLRKLGIDQYINRIFSADEVGFLKPHANFYQGLRNKMGLINQERILFVGDDNQKDIKGGNENQMDTCWFNPRHKEPEYIPTYEIQDLEELLKYI